MACLLWPSFPDFYYLLPELLLTIAPYQASEHLLGLMQSPSVVKAYGFNQI